MAMSARDLRPTSFSVPELPSRYLLDLRADCQLKCPMCLLWGRGSDTPDKQAAIGTMSVEHAREILDEIMAVKPMVLPGMWGEPLLANLREHIPEIKSRGMAVAINTNGLTLREPLARFLVEQKVDAIFFSMDATTPETLKKVRGIDKLDKIEKALHLLLRVRAEMDSKYPRIGATFTIQPENEHELDVFIDHWITVADLVRVGHVYENGHLRKVEWEEERIPCGMIYDTMPIHHDGDVSLCCFDSHKRAIVGNVFNDGGVKAVWHGEKLTQIRKHHEAGEYDKVPFCKDCNAWVGRAYKEEITERNGVKVLVRKSPQFSYFNRIDRLSSWHRGMTGHAPQDALCT